MIRLFLILLLTASSAFAYTPPIGIPDPGMWGDIHPIDSSSPNTATKCPGWPTSSSPNCYYIDNTHAQATDGSGNTYGSPDLPRATIPVKTYPAGAYIEIHGGPYVMGDVSIKLEGTELSPVWFRGNADPMPDIKAKFSMANSTYAIIENLDINNMVSGGVTLTTSMDSHHVCIRNCKFRNFSATGGAVCGATPQDDGNINNIVYYGNYFESIGNYQAVLDEDYHCINPSLWGRHPPTTVHHIWVLSNEGHHNAGNLVQFNGDMKDALTGDNEIPIRLITNTNMQNLHHLYVGKNIYTNNRQTVSSQKFSTDTIVSQNTSQSNFSTASGGATSQVYQEGANYVWFLFNNYGESDWGIRQSNTNFDTDNAEALYGDKFSERAADLHMAAIGNRIVNVRRTADVPVSEKYELRTIKEFFPRSSNFKPIQAICSEAGFYTRTIVDNSISTTGGGFNFVNNYSHTLMSGNVFADIRGVDSAGLPDYHGRVNEGSSDTGMVAMDYTFFQPRSDNGTVTFKWTNATPSTNINSLAALQASGGDAAGQCANCWQGDPMFADQTNYDLHPVEGSPLIGKGIRHPIYDEFYQRYSIEIDYDFDGNKRPPSNWTLGAYEYNTGYVPPVDTEAPVISSFNLPLTSDILTPAIVSIGATDNIRITGYVLKESTTAPLLTDPLWTVVQPTSFGFNSIGSKTLYLWAKDAAGNISTVATATTTVTEPVTDAIKPTVTAFTIPATSTSLTVPITTFTATDNTAVTGYQITESLTAPVASGSNWRVVAPSTYTCATPGSKTLYAWAIDGAGNVSLSMSASVTITVVVPPSGQGQARLQGAGHAKMDGPGHVILGN